jgi:hypothetical protein
MATILQHRRGNTAQTVVFTGNAGELFINTDTNEIVIQDGVTAGGYTVPNQTDMITYTLAFG